jgi:hypothetical protein
MLAPDAAHTLAGGGLADCSEDSQACAPNHAAAPGGGGIGAGGRGSGTSNASGTPAARSVPAAPPCAHADARGSGDRGAVEEASGAKEPGVMFQLRNAAECCLAKARRSMPVFSTSCVDRRDPAGTLLRALARSAPISRARPSAVPPKNARTCERGEDRGGRDARPPRRLHTIVKLVASSPLPRILCVQQGPYGMSVTHGQIR